MKKTDNVVLLYEGTGGLVQDFERDGGLKTSNDTAGAVALVNLYTPKELQQAVDAWNAQNVNAPQILIRLAHDLGDRVLHTDDDGRQHKGTVIGADDYSVQIQFDDGDEGWEKPSSLSFLNE